MIRKRNIFCTYALRVWIGYGGLFLSPKVGNAVKKRFALILKSMRFAHKCYKNEFLKGQENKSGFLQKQWGDRKRFKT
jgi:hypothetical protein